jgi:hypothetical protein
MVLVGVIDGVGVNVLEGVILGVGVSVLEGVILGVGVSVLEGVILGVGVNVIDGVGVKLIVGVILGVNEGLTRIAENPPIPPVSFNKNLPLAPTVLIVNTISIVAPVNKTCG